MSNNNKPYTYTYHPAMHITMPQSLYAVVYSETAFDRLTQHPSHFHTIEDAQQFVTQYCAPHSQSVYIVQVPVIAHSTQPQ